MLGGLGLEAWYDPKSSDAAKWPKYGAWLRYRTFLFWLKSPQILSWSYGSEQPANRKDRERPQHKQARAASLPVFVVPTKRIRRKSGASPRNRNLEPDFGVLVLRLSKGSRSFTLGGPMWCCSAVTSLQFSDGSTRIVRPVVQGISRETSSDRDGE